MHAGGQSNPAIFQKIKGNRGAAPVYIPCRYALKLLLANHETNLRSRMRRKFLGDRIAGCPNHFSPAGQNRPANPGASGNTRLQEQAFQFSNAPAPVRTVGVARTPISEDQWPLDAVEIKGTPTHYSVALARRPVNHFQIDAAVNFRNNNGSGFQWSWPRNGVSKIAISARHCAVLRGIRRCENTRETEPVKNSLDTNPRQVNLRAALRFCGQINHEVDVPRSQLLAAASELGKNPTYQAPGKSHCWNRRRCGIATGDAVRGNYESQWRQKIRDT